MQKPIQVSIVICRLWVLVTKMVCIIVTSMKASVAIEQVLKGFTLASAYAQFEEESKGSIQPGKLADFVVLSGSSSSSWVKTAMPRFPGPSE